MMAKKQGPMQGPAPVYRVRDAKPLTGQKKAAQTRAAKAGTAKRESWEATATGQGRTASPPMLETRVEGPTLPGDSRSTPAYANPKRHYAENDWHDSSRHPEGQMTLPGMESVASGRQAGLVSSTGGLGALPDTVPVARWHHLSNQEKLDVEAHAARFGVTRESAKMAFAANLDQAYHNSGGQPHARDFYVDQSPHMPAGHIVQAAKDTGRSVSSIATAAAITSPQTEWGPTPEGHYPNIRAARHAAAHTGPVSKVTQPTVADDSTKKIGTFRGNVRKAATAVRQEESGTLAADLRGAPTKANPQGNRIFGGKGQQKTTAFRNALVDPEGPESNFVSDVHSGGRGMAPHLSPTEAGEYLKHPGIHQWHDHIAREVMRERGLQSINNMQAAQWGQAQLDSTRGSQVQVPRTPGRGTTDVEGQQSLFGDAPHVEALKAAHSEPAWTAGDQKRHENTVAKRRRTGGLPVDPEARKAGW